MTDSIAKLARKYNIVPLKKYGQNFIFDITLCDKIVKNAALASDAVLLEVGPGPAGLTRAILNHGVKTLIVVESDIRFVPLLEEVRHAYSMTSDSLQIMNQDALNLQLDTLAPNSKLDIISNLPYNIGTKLLINWMHQIDHINSMTLMLQKEVVDRIIAQPHNKNYGRLSVICQILCDTTKCFDVSPKVFYPRPKIWSSVVKLVPQRVVEPRIIDILGRITFYGFSNRRKMIKSSLKQIAPNIIDILDKLNFDSHLRAENLSPEQYLQLAYEIS